MNLTREQKQKIQEARGNPQPTLRVVVPKLEAILHEPMPVLDHGFVRVIDYMGDDAAVVQAARVSYGKGTKKVREDAGLLNYLMRHQHSTPFEMCEIKVHVKLPIFVARQWIRHRTANVNEYSARYSILDNEFYVPTLNNLAEQSGTNRQGRGDVLSTEAGKRVQDLLREDAEKSYRAYDHLLNDENLSRELARMNLSLNFYTQWYWKTDLYNLLRFLLLRCDAHAQYEIRAYADVLLGILKRWVPLTYAAFDKYQLNGYYLSRPAMNFVRKMIAGEAVDAEDTELSKRELNELLEIL